VVDVQLTVTGLTAVPVYVWLPVRGATGVLSVASTVKL